MSEHHWILWGLYPLIIASEINNRILKQVEKSGSKEEIEAATRQVKMADVLLEYFKDGAKDPKKAHKALEEIDNGDGTEEEFEINFLLEYNWGIFAYLSQMYEVALIHFLKILEHSEEAELFLVVKSGFIVLQILVDNNQLESSKSMIKKLEELIPLLEKLAQLKQDFKYNVLDKSSGEESKKSMHDLNPKGLKLEYFSISTGSNLTVPAKAPKNPWMTEYKFFLFYFKTRIALMDWDETVRGKWLKELNNKYDSMIKSNPEKLGDMEDIVYSQWYAFIPYLNSYGALQKPMNSVHDLQTTIRLISFSDRDLSKTPNTHPSGYKLIKEADKRKEQIIQNWNQKHPLYFFNNLGMLHFNTKKYSLAAYFLSKSLKYLNLDGKQQVSIFDNLYYPLKYKCI